MKSLKIVFGILIVLSLLTFICSQNAFTKENEKNLSKWEVKYQEARKNNTPVIIGFFAPG